MKSLDKNKAKELECKECNRIIPKGYSYCPTCLTEIKPEILESWQIDKVSQEAENKAAKKFYDKAIKPKELDWVDRLKDTLDGEWFCAGLSYLRRPNSNIYDLFELHIIDEVKNIISSLLTQQRTELLEEIKTRIDTWGGFEDGGGNLCHYDSEILEWVNNLINKKYD